MATPNNQVLPTDTWASNYEPPSSPRVKGLRLRQDTRQNFPSGDSYSGYSSSGYEDESSFEDDETQLLGVAVIDGSPGSPGVHKKDQRHVGEFPQVLGIIGVVMLMLLAVIVGPALAKAMVFNGKEWLGELVHAHRWGHPHSEYGILPSLNLFRYDQDVNFPVFANEGYEHGILRKDMPQVDIAPDIKKRLTTLMYKEDGFVTVESVDLTRVYPLQSEVSGYIVFNHLLDNMREILDTNPSFFSRVMLIRTPVELQGRNGVIPPGSLLILDGHHTTAALEECARDIQTSLRGAFAMNSKLCGPHFHTVHEVVVLNGLHPLKVLDIARRSGAGYGQTLTYGTPQEHANNPAKP